MKRKEFLTEDVLYNWGDERTHILLQVKNAKFEIIETVFKVYLYNTSYLYYYCYIYIKVKILK